MTTAPLHLGLVESSPRPRQHLLGLETAHIDRPQPENHIGSPRQLRPPAEGAALESVAAEGVPS